MNRLWATSLQLALLLSALPLQAVAAPFALTSPNLRDGEMVSVDQAANGNDAGGKPCGGKNIAPALAWTGAPQEARSFALTMVDIDGRRGSGVSQWLLYNIPGTVAGLALGEGNHNAYESGRNVYDQTSYLGPCTSTGESAHHYVITLFALDQLPALPPGLDHDALIRTIQSHVLRETSLVGRYAR